MIQEKLFNKKTDNLEDKTFTFLGEIIDESLKKSITQKIVSLRGVSIVLYKILTKYLYT